MAQKPQAMPFDPTANVLQLVAAANQRQDDLREADSRRVAELSALRAYYERKLASAESKRIDAIRAVDVAAVGTASAEARAQANVLAGQVAATAETLRALVTATAAATDARIALLEKSQYQISGRSTGLSSGWGWLLGGIAALGTLFSIGAIVVGLIIFLSKGAA